MSSSLLIQYRNNNDTIQINILDIREIRLSRDNQLEEK